MAIYYIAHMGYLRTHIINMISNDLGHGEKCIELYDMEYKMDHLGQSKAIGFALRRVEEVDL